MLEWTKIADMDTYALEIPGGVLIRVGHRGMPNTSRGNNDFMDSASVVFVPGLSLVSDSLVKTIPSEDA